MIKVFVYGTLMRGNSNNSFYLKDSSFVGKGIIKGYALYDLGSYPGIIPLENEYTKGEVFEVDDNMIPRLDQLEGEGYLYKRNLVKVQIDNEVLEEVYVYIWMGSTDINRKVKVENQPWRQNDLFFRDSPR